MKYFLDTEFIETVGHIELISIGLVSDDNRELYFVNTDADLSKASKWVVDNVLTKMPEYKKGMNHFTKVTKNLHSIPWIREKIIELTAGDPDIKFYGYFADYDWVVFCWIFGTMMNLPQGFPMYCRDLKQMMDDRGLTKEWKQKNCPDPDSEHNALIDAKWNQKLYNLITNPSTHPEEPEGQEEKKTWTESEVESLVEYLVPGMNSMVLISDFRKLTRKK